MTQDEEKQAQNHNTTQKTKKSRSNMGLTKVKVLAKIKQFLRPVSCVLFSFLCCVVPLCLFVFVMCQVSCVLNSASVSKLYIPDCPFGIL
jgi:hypothetical protein